MNVKSGNIAAAQRHDMVNVNLHIWPRHTRDIGSLVHHLNCFVISPSR